MALGCMMWACLCLVNGMLVHTLQTRNNAGESTGRFPRERRRDSACRGKFPPKEGFSFPNYGARSEGGDGGPEGAGYKEAPFQAPVRSEVGPLITGDLINR